MAQLSPSPEKELSQVQMKVRDVIAKSRGTKFKGVKEPHYPVMVNKAEMGALNAMKKPIADRRSGGFVDRMIKKGLNDDTYIMKGTEPKAVATPYAVFNSEYDDLTREDEGGFHGAVQSKQRSKQAYTDAVEAQKRGDSGGGDSGGGGQRSGVSQSMYDQLMNKYNAYKGGEQGRLEEAKRGALQEQRDSARQGFVDDYTGEGGYQERLQDLEGQFDLSKERTAMQNLAGEARGLGTQYGQQMSGVTGRVGGYEGDVAGLRSGVGTLRQQQADIGTQIGKMATQAMDPSSSQMYDRNRQMLAGVAEQQRNTSDKGAMAQLARGASASGMSPEKLALAQAQLKSGQGARARQDALSSAMGAQQMTGQQLSQGAGLLGQQAGLGMQQANLYGQQAGLGAQAAGLAGQQAGMYGQTAGFQSGLLGQRSGLQGQSAGLLQQQLLGRAGLIGSQGGMTQYGLQDVVARQNEQMQMEMMEKTNAANVEAARNSSSGGGGGGGFLSSLF